MPDLTLFDVVFHWLQLRADYENTSTQSHLGGLNTENFKMGWKRDLESLDIIKVGKIQKRAKKKKSARERHKICRERQR